jgi:hypothetical protein
VIAAVLLALAAWAPAAQAVKFMGPTNFAVGDTPLVVSRQHAVPRAGQAQIVVQVAEVWTIRDGLLAERHSFATREEALEAAQPRE